MTRPPVDLPYFDFLLQQLDRGDPAVVEAFGRHAHWGYWDGSDRADGSAADYGRAAERLVERVADTAAVVEGSSVLDCGCGFGGAPDSLVQRFENVRLNGLNIDIRQLARAHTAVLRPDARVGLVQGTADELPYADASFDAVLAIECIFHFRSRERFFEEAARVLRPGGRLALTDFVLPGRPLAAVPGLAGLLDLLVRPLFGRIHLVTDTFYAHCAERSGFRPLTVHDISAETLPSFDVLRRVFTRMPGWARLMALVATRLIEVAQRSRAVRYLLMSFEKASATSAAD